MEFEIKTEGKKKTLVITCELGKAETSGSGKSDVYASTKGNKPTGVKLDGKELIAGINIYTKK